MNVETAKKMKFVHIQNLQLLEHGFRMCTSWAKGYSSHGHFLGQENTIHIGLVGAPPHLLIGLSKCAQTFAVRFLKSSSIHPICINLGKLLV